MEQVVHFLFGPLKTQSFCTFFLVMTIFGFVFLVGSFCMLVYVFSQNASTSVFWKHVSILGFYAIFYLQSRILYSMCVGSIKS